MSSIYITKRTWDYYERHCRGKKKHKVVPEAQKHMDELKKKKPVEDFNFYVCHFCSNLHVGHIKTSPAKEQSQATSAGV